MANLTKRDMVVAIAEKTGLTQKEVFDVIQLTLDGITDALAKGEGEELTFEFITTKEDTSNLAVTSCAIATGHQATAKLFKQNARPKTLQVSIDGRPAAVLELEDSMGLQNFDLPKVRLERPSRHKIAFQIVDVYPGSEFQDTCITEINFSGEGDMH